jgi:hypothetical protein
MTVLEVQGGLYVLVGVILELWRGLKNNLKIVVVLVVVTHATSNFLSEKTN